MNETQLYINKNKDRFLDELFELIRIPSVSADPAYQEHMMETAEWLKQKMSDAGADTVDIFPTDGHPIVFGSKIIDPDLPTILVYGHYDVQPADPLELWDSPPFEPIVKDERIYARGACDDKGQLFMHLKAFEAMVASDSLPCNVKMIIEGEEEVGSVHLGPFLEKNRELLSCDVILVSDTSIIANDVPAITVGLRGLTYLEVEVTGPNRDLHSGTYGGAVTNPINALCEMIAQLKDQNNHITIPGFYDDVVELSKLEREELNKTPFNIEDYKSDLGLQEVSGESGFTTLERGSIRPTLDVNGMWGGYIGEGAKTVLPSKAFAKISMRLVPHQHSEKILELFTNYFREIAPPGVEVLVHPHHGGEPAVTPTDTIEYKAAHRAMETTFGKAPIPMRAGGSIPIIPLFEQILGVKTVLFGFGLNEDKIHSPNESYGLFNFYKGIETIPYFYANYAEMMKS